MTTQKVEYPLITTPRFPCQRIDAGGVRWYANIPEDEDDPVIHKKNVTDIVSIISKGYGFDKWLGDSLSYQHACEFRDQAGKLGTTVHSLIMHLINGFDLDFSQTMLMDAGGNVDLEGEGIGIDELTPDKAILKRLMGFQRFWEEAKPSVIANELMLYHSDIPFAGTVDLVCEINGKIWILDWKTGSTLSKTIGLQLSAYKYLFEKIYGLEIDGLAAVQLKDTWRNIKKPGYLFKEYPYEIDVFNQCYNLWIWNNSDSKGNPPGYKEPPEYQTKFSLKPEEEL